MRKPARTVFISMASLRNPLKQWEVLKDDGGATPVYLGQSLRHTDDNHSCGWIKCRLHY